MNIFYLDHDPILAAQYHVDKHVVKMILESAQLLCTAINTASGSQITPYKTTHINHPSAIWVRQSRANAHWLYQLMTALNNEYVYRFMNQHLAFCKLRAANISQLIDTYLPDAEFTEPPLAMPDEYKSTDAVISYRAYYTLGKAHLHKYTKRQEPYWL